MDFITSLLERNGKNALMVCCDKLGKLSRLVPTWVGENHLAAPEVAKLFIANWVRYYGVPKRLIHDHDICITALVWRALWPMLGTRTPLFSSAYHLQTDGQTERQNHTVEYIIRALIHEGFDDWVEAIPLVELCVNNAVADSTGVSPAAFTYG